MEDQTTSPVVLQELNSFGVARLRQAAGLQTRYVSKNMKSRIVLLMVLSLVAVMAIGAWAWITKDRTIYASGFREEVFEKIKPGITRARVEELLGKPILEQDDPFPETWFYQESVSPGESRVFRIFQPSESVSF